MKTHYVYAKCFAGRGIYLQREFEGSRYQCERYLKDRVRQWRPTHFNFISTLSMDAAQRRYGD